LQESGLSRGSYFGITQECGKHKYLKSRKTNNFDKFKNKKRENKKLKK